MKHILNIEEFYLNEISMKLLYIKCYENSFFDKCLVVEKNVDKELTKKVIELIKNNRFDVNNYELFIKSYKCGKLATFLTNYTKDELIKEGIKTFKVHGYNIGFALKPIASGMEIVALHNNEDAIGGIGEFLVKAAIEKGGNKLDHYDGFLSDFYEKLGFVEYARMKFKDEYADENWNYELYGRPDIVFRELKK